MNPGYTPPPIPSYYYNVRGRQQIEKNRKDTKIQPSYSYNKIMIRIINMEVDYQVLPAIFILFLIFGMQSWSLLVTIKLMIQYINVMAKLKFYLR